MRRQATVFATRRMLLCRDDVSIGFPEVRIAMTLTIHLRDAFPQLATTRLAAITDEIRHDLASLARERNPNESASELFSGRMTIIHPTPAPSPLGRARQARPMWRLTQGVALLFFEPVADGIARHAEAALQTAQRTAFFVSAENLFAFFFGVAIGLRVLTAAALTVFAPESLFTIAGVPVAH